MDAGGCGAVLPLIHCNLETAELPACVALQAAWVAHWLRTGNWLVVSHMWWAGAGAWARGPGPGGRGRSISPLPASGLVSPLTTAAPPRQRTVLHSRRRVHHWQAT